MNNQAKELLQFIYNTLRSTYVVPGDVSYMQALQQLIQECVDN